MRFALGRRPAALCVSLAVALLAAPRATAIEFQEGRLQIHGFGEVQLRSIMRDFEPSDGWDLTQWHNVVNVEAEYDIAPDGWGPFSYMAAYGRIEVRYDCVWTHACGLARSADSFGDRAHKLPDRLSDGRTTAGEFVGAARVAPRTGRLYLPDHRIGGIEVSSLGSLVGLVPGQSELLFDRFDDFGFGRTDFKGSTDGLGAQLIGPFLPSNDVEPIGFWRDVPNPFRAGDINPVFGTPGTSELPFRPAPTVAAGPAVSESVAQGIYYPSRALRNILDDIDDHAHDQNFRQAELEWNRGASQQDEKELKELYLDLEMFDGALWGRIGRQTIVWGKTELFRNQDQFNPQDLALASLPSLEESRIALWSARFVYSFYEVGPLSDVRLELAFNFDQFEPSDVGDCGEPYTSDALCRLKAQGLFTHGVTSLGIAGEERPPAPWNSFKGLEGGVRLEWRWERFSFAITDFYGYRDSTASIKYVTFARNVDPLTGRPRITESTGICVTGAEPDCLQPGTSGFGNALEYHPANQTLFAGICASTVGILVGAGLPAANCLLTLPNVPGVGSLISGELGGAGAGGAGFSLLGTSLANLVALNQDALDANPSFSGFLSNRLSDQQEALLGCGPFYQINCDIAGIDLLNAEASVLFQSWPSFDGVPEGVVLDGPAIEAFLADPSTPNPGTVGFDGGPVATRLVGALEDQVFRVLPGARGPGEPGYDPNVDGTTTGLVHPQSGQTFRNELAAVSWNFMQTLVGLSRAAGDDPTVCGPARPLGCQLVSGYMSLAGVQNPLVSSRDRRFGRRDFSWQGGSPTLIRYEKVNILGFSMDFAEDVTATNWGIEFTWVDDPTTGDSVRAIGRTEADTFNLTISVDRPTFLTFLNRNRTFFINSQTFVSYVKDYEKTFTSVGPIAVRQTLTVNTGYFQDRLNPGVTFVYDWDTNSGAVLTSINYRYTERFRVIFGAAGFFGRVSYEPSSITPSSLSNRVGRHRFESGDEEGLSLVRNRDEVFLRLRYTF